MTVHIKRLAVGIETPDHLAQVQAARLAASKEKGENRLFTYTRMAPKRVDELVDGGSLYWIVKGHMRVRQRILGVETDVDEEGRGYCKLQIDPTLVPLKSRPHKPFQGW
ncbi:MAG: DUF1489 domain-containing protein, partial [Rhodospirillales bacterium]|nr:DUF1489 domain-containing protein [Rhodospirillales bacterium]